MSQSVKSLVLSCGQVVYLTSHMLPGAALYMLVVEKNVCSSHGVLLKSPRVDLSVFKYTGDLFKKTRINIEDEINLTLAIRQSPLVTHDVVFVYPADSFEVNF